MKIIFKISIRRKCSAENKFNPKLSNYWQKQLYDCFRKW